MKKLLVFVLIAGMMPVCVFAQETSKFVKVPGIAKLGTTKEQVLKILGTPDSPQKYDFYYERMNSELIVTFNDKTKLVESIIMRGKSPNYSLAGVGIGSTKVDVKKAFGQPEKVFSYKKSNVDCWYYPSKNLGFAFEKDHVSSFSVNECNY